MFAHWLGAGPRGPDRTPRRHAYPVGGFRMPGSLSAPCRFLQAIALAGIVLGMASPAGAQQPPAPSLENRVRELEDTVRRLQTERAAVPAIPTAQPLILPSASSANPGVPIPSPASSPMDTAAEGGPNTKVLAGWDDKEGFILRSSDDNFLLRVTGQIQTDYRAFLDGR